MLPFFFFFFFFLPFRFLLLRYSFFLLCSSYLHDTAYKSVPFLPLRSSEEDRRELTTVVRSQYDLFRI